MVVVTTDALTLFLESSESPSLKEIVIRYAGEDLLGITFKEEDQDIPLHLDVVESFGSLVGVYNVSQALSWNSKASETAFGKVLGEYNLDAPNMDQLARLVRLICELLDLAARYFKAHSRIFKLEYADSLKMFMAIVYFAENKINAFDGLKNLFPKEGFNVGNWLKVKGDIVQHLKSRGLDFIFKYPESFARFDARILNWFQVGLEGTHDEWRTKDTTFAELWKSLEACYNGGKIKMVRKEALVQALKDLTLDMDKGPFDYVNSVKWILRNAKECGSEFPDNEVKEIMRGHTADHYNVKAAYTTHQSDSPDSWLEILIQLFFDNISKSSFGETTNPPFKARRIAASSPPAESKKSKGKKKASKDKARDSSEGDDKSQEIHGGVYAILNRESRKHYKKNRKFDGPAKTAIREYYPDHADEILRTKDTFLAGRLDLVKKVDKPTDGKTSGSARKRTRFADQEKHAEPVSARKKPRLTQDTTSSPSIWAKRNKPKGKGKPSFNRRTARRIGLEEEEVSPIPAEVEDLTCDDDGSAAEPGEVQSPASARSSDAEQDMSTETSQD